MGTKISLIKTDTVARADQVLVNAPLQAPITERAPRVV
jgi:hypothetical protein